MEFDTKDEAYDFEALIVDQELINNPLCLNLALGGPVAGWTEQRKARKLVISSRKDTSGINNPFYGKKHDAATRKIMSENGRGFQTASSKPVVDLTTGAWYPSLLNACKVNDLNYWNESMRLRRNSNTAKFKRV